MRYDKKCEIEKGSGTMKGFNLGTLGCHLDDDVPQRINDTRLMDMAEDFGWPGSGSGSDALEWLNEHACEPEVELTWIDGALLCLPRASEQ